MLLTNLLLDKKKTEFKKIQMTLISKYQTFPSKILLNTVSSGYNHVYLLSDLLLIIYWIYIFYIRFH